MDVSVVTVVTLVAGAIVTLVGTWVRERAQWKREKARGELARHLPPGSRIVDLGDRGVVIDVGGLLWLSRW